MSKALDGATRVRGPGRRIGAQTVAQIEAERAEVERQFYVAVAAEEKLLALFEALDPRGALWTEDAIAEVLNQVCEALVKLPTALGHRIWKHVYRNRERWCAHRGLWDTVSIRWREGSTMTREDLLAVAVRVVNSERPEAHDGPCALSLRGPTQSGRASRLESRHERHTRREVRVSITGLRPSAPIRLTPEGAPSRRG